MRTAKRVATGRESTHRGNRARRRVLRRQTQRQRYDAVGTALYCSPTADEHLCHPEHAAEESGQNAPGRRGRHGGYRLVEEWIAAPEPLQGSPEARARAHFKSNGTGELLALTFSTRRPSTSSNKLPRANCASRENFAVAASCLTRQVSTPSGSSRKVLGSRSSAVRSLKRIDSRSSGAKSMTSTR